MIGFKKKAFTMIEILVVIVVVMLLALLLLPKTKYYADSAKQVSLEKNKQFLSALATTVYESTFEGSSSNTDRLQNTYSKLSSMSEISSLQNSLDKSKVGIGFIKGSDYPNSNKAAYILTTKPSVETFPEGTILLYFPDKIDVLLGTNTELSNKTQTEFEDITYRNIVSAGNYTLFKTSSGVYGAGYRDLTPVYASKPTYIMSSLGVIDMDTFTETYIISGSRLLVWGYNNNGELSPVTSTSASGAVQISGDLTNVYATEECNIIRKSNGDYYGIGSNNSGLLGLGSYGNIRSYTKLPLDATDKLYIGNYYALVLKKDGSVYGAGSNSDGALGLGNISSISTYTKIGIENVVKIYTNFRTSVFLTADGSLYYTGLLGDNTVKVPTKLDISNIKHVSVGYKYILVQTKDNELYGIGSNANKQFGQGSSASTVYTTFTNITPINQTTSEKVNIKEFYAVDGSTFVIDTDGVLYVAGYNYGCKLGLGDSVDRPAWTVNPYINFK